MIPEGQPVRGKLLWAFIGAEIANHLRGLTTFSSDQIAALTKTWEEVSVGRRSLAPLRKLETSLLPPEGDVKEYCEFLRSQAIFANLAKQLPSADFAYVPVGDLVSSLVLIDYEYLQELKSELTGSDPMAVAKFALPQTVTTEARVAVDTAGMTVTIQSPRRTLIVGSMHVGELPGMGLEVRYLVTSLAAMIIVSEVDGRLYLRSGTHRAYLLASLGITEILCILVREKQIPVLSGPYPVFTPTALLQPRPPLLKDFDDERLTLEMPLQRQRKVIRISADDFMIPVD